MIFLNKKIFLLVFFTISLIAALVFFKFSYAAGTGDIIGWAWSDTIGPISFNSLNCDTDGNGAIDNSNCRDDAGVPLAGPIASYKVNLDENGVLSGWAWSRVGAITLDSAKAGTPPSDPASGCGGCLAKVQSDNKVIGWARAISACDWNGTACTTNGAGINTGGWDGWIHLSCEACANPYSITLNPVPETNGSNEFLGWAWGNEVAGSISFNHENCDINNDGQSDGPGTSGKCPAAGVAIAEYQVARSAAPNNIPIADFECDNSTCRCGFDSFGLLIPCNVAPVSSCTCYDEDNSYLAFNNLSTDLDGLSDIEFSRWYEAGPGLSSPFPPSWTRELPGRSQYSMDKSPGDYKLRLIIVDKKGEESLPKDVNIEFLRGLRADFSCSEDGIDWSVSCSNISVEEGKTVWFKDISIPSESSSHVDGSINNRVWKHKDGTVFGNGESTATTTASMNTSEITLAVADTNNHKGEKMQSLKVIPLPRWKELPPFK